MKPARLINFGYDWHLSVITLPERKVLDFVWFLFISTELEKWFNY